MTGRPAPDCIAPDTNVVVSASISYHVPELGREVRDKYYEEFAELFALPRDNPSRVAGCLVPTVMAESFRVLPRAVKSVFLQTLPEHLRSEGFFYGRMILAANQAERTMMRLMRLLDTVEPDGGRVAACLGEVDDMCADLMRRSGERGTRDAVQLRRFARGHPNSQDGLILAEAMTLGRDGVRVVVASRDSGFFSPHAGPRGVSDPVTREIYGRFGVRCGTPGGRHPHVWPGLGAACRDGLPTRPARRGTPASSLLSAPPLPGRGPRSLGIWRCQ